MGRPPKEKEEPKQDTNKDFEHLLKEMENKYNIKRASEITKDEYIKTGVFALDTILGKGIPLTEGGYRLELFGGESTGKTTFSLKIMSEFQKLGKTCAFISGEAAYDTTWAEIQGVNNERVLFATADSLEQMGDILVDIIPKTDLIIIDSIVSLIPETEIERDTNEPTMGQAARTNALICRKIYQVIAKTKCVMIFINQLREKIGVLYGSPYTTGGGHALKHLYSARVEFRVGAPIDIGSGDTKERIGSEIKLHCVKNKKGIPNKVSVCDFYYDLGRIDNRKSIFFSALKFMIIKREGNTYSFKDIKEVGQEKFIEKLTEEVLDILTQEIWKVQK